MREDFNETIKAKLSLLPELPGVYKMLDESGTVIYVGKAKVLKNRVSQYFHSRKNIPGYERKVSKMVSHIADFEYIITESETEALILESNLIKQFMPHYNILLKDDKHFPYIRVDLRADFPRFSVVRKIKSDGARYWGPYLGALSLNESLTAIRDFFPVRHCKKDISKAIARNERPCLMYHLKKCCAPCSGNVTKEEYHELLNKVCRFLDGDTTEICAVLTDKMMQASEKMDYESAALYRDRIDAIKTLAQKQRASASKSNRYDVFAVVQNEGDSFVYALFVHEGNVIGSQGFMLEGHNEDACEVQESILKQFYSETVNIPREILIYSPIEDASPLEEWFKKLSGHSVHIVCPQRGEKKALADMAYSNAEAELQKNHNLKQREWERGEGALAELSAFIGLDIIPERIECYDNSHIMGTDTVGAMIVFVNGKPNKNEYRRFKIKSDANGDDYLAMEEMLTRRFEKAQQGDEKFSSLPDLIIADGGRGQLNVVLNVLEKFGLSHIPAIGLAEQNEEIILPDYEQPLVLDKHTAPLHLIQRIRDEAHRFAITYHRSLRSKTALFSVLDDIEGIGAKRKKALFDKFISIQAIKSASIEELENTNTMNKASAQSVYDYFHK